MEDRKFRRSLLSTRDVKDVSVLGLNENVYDNINNNDISLFTLSSTGKTTINDIKSELKLNGYISLNDLKGKSSGPNPKDCDYYFLKKKRDIIRNNFKKINMSNFDLLI